MAIIDDLKKKDPEALKKMETATKQSLITYFDSLSKEIKNLKVSLEAIEQDQKKLEGILVDLFGKESIAKVGPGAFRAGRNPMKNFDEGR